MGGLCPSERRLLALVERVRAEQERADAPRPTAPPVVWLVTRQPR